MTTTHPINAKDLVNGLDVEEIRQVMDECAAALAKKSKIESCFTARDEEWAHGDDSTLYDSVEYNDGGEPRGYC